LLVELQAVGAALPRQCLVAWCFLLGQRRAAARALQGDAPEVRRLPIQRERRNGRQLLVNLHGVFLPVTSGRTGSACAASGTTSASPAAPPGSWSGPARPWRSPVTSIHL